MIETIGILGAIFLGLCSLPQALASYRNKSSQGIDGHFLAMWALGELLTIAYVVSTSMDKILLLNYAFNITCLSVIIFYKIKEVKKWKK